MGSARGSHPLGGVVSLLLVLSACNSREQRAVVPSGSDDVATQSAAPSLSEPPSTSTPAVAEPVGAPAITARQSSATESTESTQAASFVGPRKSEPQNDPSYRPPWWRPEASKPSFASLAELEARSWQADERRSLRPAKGAGDFESTSLLNYVHSRLHPVFSDHYLVLLESLASDHPTNDMDLAAVVEIEIDPHNGKLTQAAVPKSSGVPLFDAIALESFRIASPFTVPELVKRAGIPIVLRWELHRLPQYACSAYFARVVRWQDDQEERDGGGAPKPHAKPAGAVPSGGDRGGRGGQASLREG